MITYIIRHHQPVCLISIFIFFSCNQTKLKIDIQTNKVQFGDKVINIKVVVKNQLNRTIYFSKYHDIWNNFENKNVKCKKYYPYYTISTLDYNKDLFKLEPSETFAFTVELNKYCFFKKPSAYLLTFVFIYWTGNVKLACEFNRIYKLIQSEKFNKNFRNTLVKKLKIIYDKLKDTPSESHSLRVPFELNILGNT